MANLPRSREPCIPFKYDERRLALREALTAIDKYLEQLGQSRQELEMHLSELEKRRENAICFEQLKKEKEATLASLVLCETIASRCALTTTDST